MLKKYVNHISYVGWGLLYLVCYGEVWSLLAHMFYTSYHGYITPWYAAQLGFNHALNPAKLNLILCITALLPLALVLYVIYERKENEKWLSIYGNTKWANNRDLQKIGLFEPGDVVLGWRGRRLLMAKLVSHILLFAPSRSGKGVAQVIPNALTYIDSLLVTDMKLEVFHYTSGFRAAYGQAVWCFAPSYPNHRTHCYNPLFYVSADPGKMIADLQMILEILIPGTVMWDEEARGLALGLLLWLKDSSRPFTLAELNNLVKATPDLAAFIQEQLTDSIIADNLVNMNSVAYMNLNNFVQKAEKERSGVKSTLTAKLNLWDDPYIAAATSTNDFDMRDIRKKRMTIYLGIPTNQLQRLAPLMNLFVQQFLSVMTDEMPGETEPHHVLAILDEFTNLGAMHKLRQGFSYLAGYHIHLMPIIQNIGQFYELYGNDASDTFFQNTDYKIMYRQNALTDKEFVSKNLGTKTIRIKTRSRQAHKGIISSGSENEQYAQVPFMTADNVGMFPMKEAILQLNGERPIRYNKIIYYKNKIFKERLYPAIQLPLIEPLHPIIQVKAPPTTEIGHENTNSESALTENELTDLLNID